MNKPIWVAGEVLIDLIPQPDGQRLAVVGGGPANTAKALARLGFDSYFIDGMSTNEYGQKAKAELEADGVKLDYVKFSDKPMCLATVTLDASGSASYEFLIDGTATFDFQREWLPTPAVANPAVFHVGTLVPLIEPGASALFEWAQEINQFAPIVFDPNVRPSVVGDRVRYEAIVRKWAAISNIVKVSEDDIAWLYPGRLQEEVAADWLSMGVDLVVITLGSEGLLGITRQESIRVPGVKVDVVDTVGAGDTVGAILVEGVVKYGVTGLVGDTLRAVLTRAASAAAITCSRAGANPPYLNELSN
jgi:fructokinase